MMLALFATDAGTQTAFVLFGCALFAAALFVYIFYRPDDAEQGDRAVPLLQTRVDEDAHDEAPRVGGDVVHLRAGEPVRERLRAQHIPEAVGGEEACDVVVGHRAFGAGVVSAP